MVSQYLIDIFVRHQVHLERLKTMLANEADPFLAKMARLVTRALNDAGVDSLNELSRTKLEALIKTIRADETELLSEYGKQLQDKLPDVATSEAQFAELALGKAIATDVAIDVEVQAWVAAKTQPIQATGQLLEPFIDGWTDRTTAQVEATLRNASAQGWTVDQTVRAIRGTKGAQYTDGLLSATRREVTAMVRTAVQHTASAAQQAIYKANDDIVSGYMFIATLDNRTTQVCRSLDRKEFKLGNGPMPPLHINCRSTTVPIIIGGHELVDGPDTRAAKGAQGGTETDASDTYYTWLKRQPKGFQDSAIGPTRGKLLRDGGLSAEQFARLNLGRTFQPLTLEQMRKLNPVAFERAGL